MSQEPLSLFHAMEIFRPLPSQAIDHLAAAAVKRAVKAGEVLFTQGRSTFDGVYVIGSGQIELSCQQSSERRLVDTLAAGSIFGGIAVLFNSGRCVRTATAMENGTCWVIPIDLFRELSNRYPDLRHAFEQLLAHRMNDTAYAAMFAGQRALRFLQGIPPFSFLPAEETERLASLLTLHHVPADTILCTQGTTAVEHLYIVKHGAALRYFHAEYNQGGGSPMGEGDLFGGISMLINDSQPLRSLRTTEDSSIYLLEKAHFLDVCRRYPHFRDYFTDTFGKRMLDRSYAAIVAKTMQPDDASQPFLHQTVREVCSMRLVCCPETATIQEAARLMSDHGSGSILIQAADGEVTGIVTDRDLRQRLLASGRPATLPVTAIMSAPVRTISGQALVVEAVMLMMQGKIKRLAVTDTEGRLCGVITTTDLLTAQSNSPLFLVQEINASTDLATLRRQHQRLPGVIQACIASGAKAEHLNRLITALFDATLTVIIEQALATVGPPPCPFAFLVLGSDGRKEQTLKTDQDNAIIYSDPPGDKAQAWHNYFLELGEKICSTLDAVGYSFCPGEIMAKNPTWCQPLAVWKNYFSSWVRAAEPEDLLSCSIFFDFRCGSGDNLLVEELRSHLQQVLAEWPSFLQFLAFNTHHFKPPIGFFRNFIVESRGEHRDTFDIKKVMVPIVDYARLYALKQGLAETNTQERLRLLAQQDAIRHELYLELSQAYSFLMQLRLSRQAAAIQVEKRAANNYINPRKLSRIEQTTLKEIFSRIEKVQKEVAYGLS